MAQTQKMYLGDTPIGITRFGEHGNTINGAFPYSLAIDYLVVGAGGGGFLMFMAKDRNKLRHAMNKIGLSELRFSFDFEGSKLVLSS